MEFLRSSMRKPPRQVERCAVLGPWSQGETAFSPSHLIIWPRGKSKRKDYRSPIGFGSLAAISSNKLAHSGPSECEHHKFVRELSRRSLAKLVVSGSEPSQPEVT